ncbi:MAG: PAS domain S-box protein [Gloeocapsa sp. UFS-A4-WI-NPMV-4B04]|jgi:PAS domain S-box-containing protein|nr:PAS domain S-box protein [Gloeocapsa sp. UFS-A4-WI-NPMV-4B04]
MNRILLLLEHKENRRLLSELLATHYEVILPNSDTEASGLFLQNQVFDLCILDAITLDKRWRWVQAKREAEQPVLLPFLLITSRQDVGMVTRQLWQNIDDLITKPIEKVELQAQVEILLRSRQLSLELKAANEKLEGEVTQRQHLVSALAKNQAKFRALVQNSSDIITVLDGDGIVTYQSPCSKNVLGFDAEELEEKHFFDFVHPDDVKNVIASFQASLNNPSETQISEYRFRHQDNSWHYLESKINFPGIDSDLNGVIVNSRDITERKQVEAEIRNALTQAQELNELKSRFVSMVSHEIRNPLNSVLAATEILERYSERWSQEKKQDFFQRIKNGVSKMTDLLDDVLFMGRVETGRLEVKPVPFDLEKFCRDLIKEIKLSTGSQHAIAFVSQGQCADAYLDKKLLGHILTNLLSNAIKYSPQGGTIDFKLTCQDGEVIFQIQDRGIGIPPEDMERLFESFHRASNVKNIPGTGLGLAIVKRCIELQKGKISVTSEVGKGTIFTITLPLHSEILIETNNIEQDL